MRSGRLIRSSPASIVPYQSFKTADGDILLGGGNDRLFGVLCARLERPQWAEDSRFTTNALRVRNRAVLEPLIEEVTVQKSTGEWLDRFEGSGMPYAAVNDVQSTLKHEHSKNHPLLAVAIEGTIQSTYELTILLQLWRATWCTRSTIPHAARCGWSTRRSSTRTRSLAFARRRRSWVSIPTRFFGAS